MPLRHDIRRGAACMFGATLLFAVMGSIAKSLMDHFSFLEVMFFRSSLSLPIVLALALRNRVTLRTRRFKGHFLRACTGVLGMSCGFYTLAVLPLAEQTAIGYTGPLFVTILSIFFLKEVVGFHRWAAVIGGFVGVLVIAFGKGGGGEAAAALPLLGVAVGLGGGLCSAVTTLLVRDLSGTESSSSIVLWQAILMSAILACMVPFVWTTPSFGQFLLMLLMGLIGGLAQVLLTEAYASAQVSAIGPYSYTGLIWAGGLGWMFWGEVPGLAMIIGSLLIVAAGLYILHRELLHRRPAA